MLDLYSFNQAIRHFYPHSMERIDTLVHSKLFEGDFVMEWLTFGKHKNFLDGSIVV